MRIRSAVVYTVLRLLAFLVPLGIMMLFPVFQRMYWFALLFATLIGLSLSIIFLRKPLNDVSAGLEERRAKRARRTALEKDADTEDAVDDDRREHDPAADVEYSSHDATTNAASDAPADESTQHAAEDRAQGTADGTDTARPGTP